MPKWRSDFIIKHLFKKSINRFIKVTEAYYNLLLKEHDQNTTTSLHYGKIASDKYVEACDVKEILDDVKKYG